MTATRATVPQPTMRAKVQQGARDLLREARRLLRGRDLALVAAGLTFYSGIAVVPSLLLAVRLTAIVTSPGTVERLGERVAELLPDELGAPDVARTLVEAGLGLTWFGALVAVLPASFYGEGLRRVMSRFVQNDDTFTGWRGRVLVVPLLLAAPPLMYALLLTGQALVQLEGAGVASALARIVVGFVAVWLTLTVPIAWVYRVVAPVRTPWPVVVVGALATASFLSGFLQGFVLFLRIPVDLGVPFGGLDVVGAVVALGFWLFLLHLVVLLGWVATRALSAVWRLDP
jgi:membrane protein